MTGLGGIIDYDPAELVLTVGAGTPLAEIQALVESRRQMLAFDPFDHGPLFGRSAGAATIGGVLAAGVSGSRRLSRGAARDHLLGFKAVSGRGEVFVGGAKVVKNVTGYDLPKIACGGWGRLFALAEVTVKVLPRPPVSLTLAVEGLLPRGAVAVMSRALGSQADVAAAAHTTEGAGLTALRLEGFGPSVAARRAALELLLADSGPVRALDEAEAEGFWGSLRTLEPLAHGPALWRLSLPARRAPDLTRFRARERARERDQSPQRPRAADARLHQGARAGFRRRAQGRHGTRAADQGVSRHLD
jgi:glycolate oxidase FAD binding subunit